MKFFIVDAFADERFGGNPAGVVIVPDGEAFPSDEVMVKTAAELRYSETAFLRARGNSEFDVRYFTPAAEVDLCGHATIATFYVLNSLGMLKTGEPCTAHTKAGALAIEVDGSNVLMDMGEAKALGTIEEEGALAELYGVMGIDADVPDRSGDILYPEMISTGLPDIMLPVKDDETLDRIRPDFPALSDLSERYNVTGVHAFVAPNGSGDIRCRNFAPLYDIDEEAATGTANGALTYYLYRKGFVAEGDTTVFLQGESMDRPSKIATRITKAGEQLRIQVGGTAVILVEGRINL